MNIVQRIETLFDRWGRRLVVAGPYGSLSLLEHSLQCAALAQWTGADDALVASAVLHDLGHLLVAGLDCEDALVAPETTAVRFLAHDFGPDMLEPIRLQADARRRRCPSRAANQ